MVIPKHMNCIDATWLFQFTESMNRIAQQTYFFLACFMLYGRRGIGKGQVKKYIYVPGTKNGKYVKIEITF